MLFQLFPLNRPFSFGSLGIRSPLYGEDYHFCFNIVYDTFDFFIPIRSAFSPLYGPAICFPLKARFRQKYEDLQPINPPHGGSEDEVGVKQSQEGTLACKLSEKSIYETTVCHQVVGSAEGWEEDIGN